MKVSELTEKFKDFEEKVYIEKQELLSWIDQLNNENQIFQKQNKQLHMENSELIAQYQKLKVDFEEKWSIIKKLEYELSLSTENNQIKVQETQVDEPSVKFAELQETVKILSQEKQELIEIITRKNLAEAFQKERDQLLVDLEVLKDKHVRCCNQIQLQK